MSVETHSPEARPASPPQRRQRTHQVGVVTSAGRQKTIAVEIAYKMRHPKYNKFISRRTKFHAHDEQNECNAGDLVEIVQCRPLSKTKTWRLVRVLQKAPQQKGARG